VKLSRRDLLRLSNAAAGWSLLASTTREAPAPSSPLNLFDFESAARERLSAMVYAFIAGGAGDELTVRWNREALDRLRLCPRNLESVADPDMQVHLPGLDAPHPILLAPIGFHRLMHADGELATVRGANAAQATMVVSMGTTTPIDALVRAATQPLWSQIYLLYGRSFIKDVVLRVQSAGVKAVVVTIDTPSNGPRNRQDRAGFAVPPNLPLPLMTPSSYQGAADAMFVAKASWKDLEWVRSIVRVPLWVKGVLNPLDAQRAVDAGAAGIIVSNHGGRNLDTNPATIDALPRVADIVAGRVPILMDGGIRRGTDVLKAIALGASAVLIGRPYVYGLAAAGSEGVTHVVEILKRELAMAMMLAGRSTLSAVDRAALWS
jgi:4-hydroxymandelate oxidase